MILGSAAKAPPICAMSAMLPLRLPKELSRLFNALSACLVSAVIFICVAVATGYTPAMDATNLMRLIVFGTLAGIGLIVWAWWYTFRLAQLRGVAYPWPIAVISALLGTPFLGWAAIMLYLWWQPNRQ